MPVSAARRVSCDGVGGVVGAGAGDERHVTASADRPPELDLLVVGRAPGASPVVPVTTRPSLPCSTSQRASVAARSRSSAPVVVERRDHRGESPRRSEPSWSLTSCSAERSMPKRGKQVLVQLEPDRVVRVDHRLGEPVLLACLDPFESRGQTGTVATACARARPPAPRWRRAPRGARPAAARPPARPAATR